MANTKHTIISRPTARSERLLIEAIGDETVIYDQNSNLAHALKPLAGAVFSYADGTRTTTEIAELATERLGEQITKADVDAAVSELDALNLLETPDFELDTDAGGVSRRTALKVFAATGAGAALITTATASASVNQANLGWYSCPNLNGSITYGTQTWPQPGASPDNSGYSWQADGAGEEPINALGNAVYYNEPCVYTDTSVSGGVCVTPGTAASPGTCAIPTGTCSYHSSGSNHTATLTALDCFNDHPGSSSHVTTWTEGGGTTSESTTAGNCSAWDVTTSNTSSGGHMTMSGTDVTHSGSGSSETYTFTPPSGAYTAGTGGSLPTYTPTSGSSCPSGQTFVKHGVVGGWECVPCDGTNTGNKYTCCSIVCTPSVNPNPNVPLSSPGEPWAAGHGFNDKNGNHYLGYEIPNYKTAGYYGKFCTGNYS